MNVKTSQQNKPGLIAIVLILFASAALRFYNLGTLSFSNDELSSLIRIRYNSFHEMISNGVYIDFHPAGLQTFLYYWVKLFGDGVFAVRFPFAVASVLSVWLIYAIGRKWYNEGTALMAAASFGLLVFPITFTQLARMYSLGVFTGLLTVYYWSDLIFSARKNKNLAWTGWVIAMSISLHLHYFSFVFVAVVGLSGLFFVRGKEFIKYLSGGIIALLTFIPEIPVFLAQMKTGDIGGWLGPPSKYFLVDFLYELFNRSFLICTLIILFFVTGIFSGNKIKGINRMRILSLAWFLSGFTIAYLYSILGHPILMYSTMLFATPYLLLLIFSFFPKYLLTNRNTMITLFLFSSLLLYDTVVRAKYFSTNHFGVFKEVAEDAENWSKKFGEKNVPVIVNVINPDYLKYYFNKMNKPPLVAAYKIETPPDFSVLYSLAGKSSSPYFAYVWSNSMHPWEVPGIIRNYYPYLIEKKNYFNAGSYLFSKQPADTEVKTELFSSLCDFENTFWSVSRDLPTREKYLSGCCSQKMDVEYGASFKRKISEIPGNGYRYVTFSAWVYITEKIPGAKLVISIDRNERPVDYHTVLLSDFNLKENQWQPVIFSAEFPSHSEPGDVLNAYIWNPSKIIFYADDLKITVYEDVYPYKRDMN